MEISGITSTRNCRWGIPDQRSSDYDGPPHGAWFCLTPIFTPTIPMPESTTSTCLNCTADSLRQYLGQTANLPDISDPDLDLEVLDAPDTIVQDAVIEFRISAYGFKNRMKHKYTKVSDTEIVAEQIDGPTRKWIHTQTIASTGETTCELVDHIEFEPPGGMLGFVMTADKILESIQDGMDHRYETLQEKLDG